MFLLHLHTQRSQVGGLPGELAPKTVEQAYDIQDAMHQFAGWDLGLIKVGCTSVVAQQALAIPHPIAGRIPSERIYGPGAEVPAALFASEPFLESEVALQIGADGAVTAAAPAVEIAGARYVDTTKVSGPMIIADNSAGNAAVIGEPIVIRSVDEVADLVITLAANGEQVATGGTAQLVDGVLGSLEWALAHEAERGRAVADGTWIITGTCTGLVDAEFGSTYRADFADLGAVEFSFTEP